jgi:hypothetical protein
MSKSLDAELSPPGSNTGGNLGLRFHNRALELEAELIASGVEPTTGTPIYVLRDLELSALFVVEWPLQDWQPLLD